jgi:hypothetical protein
MLVNAIITKLKTSTLFPTVILFGDTDKMPDPPYVVVKPESGAIEGTRQYRIIAHTKQGLYDNLDEYIFRELPGLLIFDRSDNNNKRIYLTDEAGDRYRLDCGGYTDISADSSDNTIFMERIFFQPQRL